MRSKELSDVTIAAQVRRNGEESIAVEFNQMRKTEEKRGERNTPEMNPTGKPVEKARTAKERRGDALTPQTDLEVEGNTESEMTKAGNIEGLLVKKMKEGYTPKTFLTSTIFQEETKTVLDTVEYADKGTEVAVEMRENRLNLVPDSEEERERQLVAGIGLHEARREIVKHAEQRKDVEHVNYKELEKEKGGQVLINSFTSLSTFPVTPTQIPQGFSHLPTHYTTDSFQPPSVNIHIPNSVSHIADSTVSPGRHLKQKDMEEKADSVSEDAVMVKSVLLKPAWKEVQTQRIGEKREINRVVQPHEGQFILLVQTATIKPSEAKFITGEPDPRSESKHNSSARALQLAHRSNASQSEGEGQHVELMESYTKVTVEQNKASLPQPQLSKPSARPQLATAKTPSVGPAKSNKHSKNKPMKKSKEKRKKKKNNKTSKPPKKKKETSPPTHFPYFMDNYCPRECACYGR